MHAGATARRMIGLCAGLPLLLAGCAGSPLGGAFGIFPSQSHRLLETAKELRQANAGPLALPRELQKQPLPAYVVEPGDVLLVQPADLDSPVRLPGDQPVLPDGTIDLGKFGRLLVAGKTLPEIEAMVRAAVQAQVRDAGFISVRLIVRQSKVFYVLGEVNAPGAFHLAGRETVLDAIVQAGGLTDSAAGDQIILSRPSHPDQCRVVLPVCYRQITQLGDTTTNYQIAPGDRIYVPSKTLLETIFPSHRVKAPCGGVHVPCVLPPLAGPPCDAAVTAPAAPPTDNAPGPILPSVFQKRGKTARNTSPAPGR